MFRLSTFISNFLLSVNTAYFIPSINTFSSRVSKCFTGTSIGKRYARTDELGVPFAITVDSDTSVTIRERDSKDQVRVSVEEAASVVKGVSEGHTTWADVWSTFPHHSSASQDD